MRISDWSSDVCSSDLSKYFPRRRRLATGETKERRDGGRTSGNIIGAHRRYCCGACIEQQRRHGRLADADRQCSRRARRSRSEEHTSELQSLMRISYAVVCLIKKTHGQTNELHVIYDTNCYTRVAASMVVYTSCHRLPQNL